MRTVCVFVIVLMTALFVMPCVSPAEKIVTDGIAAQVNNNSITIGDVTVLLQPVQKQLAAKYSGSELKDRMKAAYTNALNSMIERKLILDAYEKQENKFPENYINERVEEITQDMFSGDRADLMAALAKERLNYEEWRKEIKNHVIATLMRRVNVEQNVTISASTVRKKYDENSGLYKAPARIKLRMIVLGGDVPGGEAGSARKKAEELRKKLAGGADFAETAKAESEGNKAADGGDWGWIEPKILRPELADAAAQLKTGEISRVIEAEDQFYILKAEDRKDEAVTSFVEVQSQIERELRKAEAEKVYGAWIERLRKNAYIKVFDTDLF